MSDQHRAADIHSWTATADRRWFARCDLCRRRRLVADYFEGYRRHNGESVWLWVCSGCLLNEISDRRDRKETPAGVSWIELPGVDRMVIHQRQEDRASHVAGTWPEHRCALCAAMIERRTS